METNILIAGQLLSTKSGIATNLTYLAEAPSVGKLRYIQTRCVCGAEVVKQLATVKAGTATGCGKSACRVLALTVKKSFSVGEHLTTDFTYQGEDRAKSTTRHRYMLVKCSCGATSSIRIDALARNVSCRKCGLLKRRNTMTKKHKDSLFLALQTSYIRNAKLRNYAYDIDFELFKKTLLQNCFYCGVAPSNKVRKNYRSTLYSGIDRMNNTLGYTKDNIVACCATCNRMKNALNKDAFLVHIQQIIRHLNI